MTGFLRCHLLIGPPGSGKSSLAALLAPLVGSADQPAEILATDQLRAELYGDPSIQGPWPELEALLQERLQAAVAAGRSVIVDATHARRPWRLALTQALALPQPVEWIGWWLQTELPVCQAWNRQRPQPVPEAVLCRLYGALQQEGFQPDRSEGFAAVLELDPGTESDPEAMLQRKLEGLDRSIRALRSRYSKLELHGYSRLLDLERLLYLLQLLSRFPGLTASDHASRRELEDIAGPLPEGSMAQRAAALLGPLRGRCYADVDALEMDLAWLERQGFLQARPVRTPIMPPPRLADGPADLGGWPHLADRAVFVRVMVLLRHLLQQPFDRQAGTPLAQHLINQLQGIEGTYAPRAAASLRKDIQLVLSPYGFRPRNDNVRHGHGLGTALLPAGRLLELHHLVAQEAGRLGDPSAQDLLQELEERLRWGGILPEDALPVRVFANRSIVHPELVRSDSLALPHQAEKLEAAIEADQWVVLQRYGGSARHAESPEGELRVWPLQLVFHNIGWYLAYEEDGVGRSEGLIRCERLDRLGWRQLERGQQRPPERPPERRREAVARLARLMEVCGGIYFGDDLQAQLDLASDEPERMAPWLVTVRFHCTAAVFGFLREGLQRFPLCQIRLSRPLPGDGWTPHPQAPHCLEPSVDSSHPYPVELDVPQWTSERDVDFRRWLGGYGEGITGWPGSRP
ncbi:ATP-binding protein [Synechococcus sp. CBW1006]|uniref:ATP-binding protein n=1 Tax=Synechococcus sp. CBW1006 TaxID=1353138 RepID=UPI0018CCD082|nr:ATP-binding protein [Synechococcus sp. CBW1006]QPN66538.1 ATP-binding protein [Synechococcus sp. CBW1006]